MMTCARAVAALLLLTIGLEAQQILNTPSATYPTIQSAINSAADGDTVQIAAGTYSVGLVCTKAITLAGAGPNLTIIDPNYASIGIDVALVSGTSMTVRDLTITRGNTCLAVTNNSPTPIVALKLQNCEITWGQSAQGAGLNAGSGLDLTLIDTAFRDNGIPLSSPTSQSRDGGGIYSSSSITATNCEFTNNVAEDPGTGSGGLGGAVCLPVAVVGLFEGCRFDGNRSRRGGCIYVSGGGGVAGRTTLLSSTFTNNFASEAAACLFKLASALDQALVINSCLFADNSTTANFSSKVIYVSGLEASFTNCTFANNNPSDTSTPLMAIAVSSGIKIRNSILSGNGNDAINWPSPNYLNLIRNSLSGNSYFAGGINLTGFNIVGLQAGFRDIAAGDYRLLPGSPAVDAGFNHALVSNFDLDGLPRNQLARPDMGCYELQPGEEDPGANWAGTVSDLMTGFDDVLLVNGSAGDIGRRVTTEVGTTTTIAVEAAPGTLSGNFIIWGRIGLPGTLEAFPIPFAQGSMAFVPHLLAVGNPSLFTLASTSLPGGLFAATPAPWSVTGSSLPFPLTITLQGLIETGGGNVRLTNAIAVHNF